MNHSFTNVCRSSLHFIQVIGSPEFNDSEGCPNIFSNIVYIQEMQPMISFSFKLHVCLYILNCDRNYFNVKEKHKLIANQHDLITRGCAPHADYPEN